LELIYIYFDNNTEKNSSNNIKNKKYYLRKLYPEKLLF